MFNKYAMFREMASFSLPHPTKADGGHMPCPGKITIAYIDMRFEDYGQSQNFPQGSPFWAKMPGENVYLVYHGDKAELLSSEQATPYIERYKAAPPNWWKYAEALNKDYDRIKEPAALRGDYEKVDPKICKPIKVTVVPRRA